MEGVKNKKKQKEKLKKLNLKKVTAIVIAGILLVYFIWTLISQQISISKKNGEIAELERKIEEVRLESDRLSKEVENLNDPEYIEKIARERLGLVRPNERVFVDSNKSKDNSGK